MIVVADSSPLIALVNIRHIDILPTIFGEIIIPPQIAAELKHANRPQHVREFVAQAPEWLRVQSPLRIEHIARLHEGEVAAICLAQELKASLLLIDEIAGRREAARRGISIAGTIGVLEAAADRNLVDLAEAFAQLKSTDFWVSPDFLDERLAAWRQKQADRR